MTLLEAIIQKINKLTRPEWSHTSYIELHLLDNGNCGPWVKVYTLPLEPVDVLITELPRDGWQVWESQLGGSH